MPFYLFFYVYCRNRCRLEGHPLQVTHKQDWGRGFILLLPQTTVLPRSDAGSDVVKPASGFVIKTVIPRVPCDARCMGTLLEHGLRFVQWCRTRNSVRERDRICA